MRTQIYEHRSGLKVVPRDIVSDVKKNSMGYQSYFIEENGSKHQRVCTRKIGKRGMDG